MPSPLALATAAFSAELDKPLAAGLHIVATPIGNLGDITLRALATLAKVDVIYCEDTRHSRVLARHFGFSAPLKAYHDHNGEAARPEILAALAAGKRVALISDAGTPLISDPGYKLVEAAVRAGHRVLAVPGASAVLAALAASGLPTDRFLFAGFFPPKSAARSARLAELATIDATLVLFEAPSRLAGALADIATTLGPREVVVARELTKLHETIVRGTVAEVAAAFAGEPPPGECVVLVGPPAAAPATDDVIRDRLAVALEDASTRDAAQSVAEALGVPRGRVYELALAIKRERGAASG